MIPRLISTHYAGNVSYCDPVGLGETYFLLLWLPPILSAASFKAESRLTTGHNNK